MKRALLAAVAAALLVAWPAAEPVSAQATDPADGGSCTTVVTSSRVVSELLVDGVVQQRLIEQTVVDRCTTVDGGTQDGEARHVRFWQQLA